MDKIQDDLKSLQDSVKVRQERIDKEKVTVPKNTSKKALKPGKKK